MRAVLPLTIASSLLAFAACATATGEPFPREADAELRQALADGSTTGHLVGRVSGDGYGWPAGIPIWIDDREVCARTDSGGQFTIPDVRPGERTLIVHPGSGRAAIRRVRIQAGETRHLELGFGTVPADRVMQESVRPSCYWLVSLRPPSGEDWSERTIGEVLATAGASVYWAGAEDPAIVADGWVWGHGEEEDRLSEYTREEIAKLRFGDRNEIYIVSGASAVTLYGEVARRGLIQIPAEPVR